MLVSKRTDLLAYLEDYGQSSRRWVGRLDKWRLRRSHRARIGSAAAAVAAELTASDIRPGDYVGIHVADGPLWMAAFFGVLRCGAVAVPIDSAYPAEMAIELASSIGLKSWVQDEELPDLPSDLPVVHIDWKRALTQTHSPSVLPPMPRDDSGRLAEVVLTSGTSSDPRSVPVTHANLRSVLDALHAEVRRYRWAVRMTPTLHIAVALPMSHLYGQVMGAYLPVLLSANVSFVETMPAAHLARVLRQHSTWVLATVPYTLSKLGRHLMEVGNSTWGAAGMKDRLHAARGMPWHRRWKLFAPVRREMGWRFIAVVSGGAELDVATEDLWRRLGYLVIQGYGLTEAAPLVTMNHPFRPSPGTLGKPLPGIEVTLAESGEILVRGDNVTATTDRDGGIDAQGWLHTGDFGELDESGSIRFAGRKSDRIVTPAGMNIDAAKIAAELRRHAGIQDAVVLESPWGGSGSICAVLAVRPGADALAAVRATNQHLPDVARVRGWFLWPGDDLPRTPTGKPRRGPILEWLREQHAAGEQPPVGAITGASAEEIICNRIADLCGQDSSEIDRVVPLGDLLDSLGRVELAASLEQSFGLNPRGELFTGGLTVSQLADDLRAIVHRPDETSAEPAGEPMPVARRGQVPGKHPPAQALRSGAKIDIGRLSAEWRYRRSTRLTRWLLQEVVVRPALAGCLRVRSSGLENLVSQAPPFLLACNHVSILDPLVLLTALPSSLRRRIAPAARWQHFVDHPRGARHYRWGVLGLNLFPLVQVGDWRASLSIAGRLADHGYCPLIYPEGRRSHDGSLGRLQLGITVLSRELHLPVLPCATAGLHAVMPVGSRWPARRGLHRPTVAVCFGEPIPAVHGEEDGASALRDIEANIAALHRRALDISGAS